MTNLIDMRTRSGPLVVDLVLAPLMREGQRPLVVDAGARSGMLELPRSYATRAALIAFEPNPIEHTKLVNEDTDPIRAGHRPPRFADETFLDVALWDEEGEETLVITNGPGTATLMGEAEAKLTSNVYRAGEHLPFYDAALRTVERVRVKTQRLDKLVDSNQTVDFLKIDVEGGELRVLRGASRLLEDRCVLVVRSEFVTLTHYPDHPILGDQHRFLHDAGFRLVDLDAPARYTRGRTTIPYARDRRPLRGGDAIYVLDPDRIALDPVSLHRMAAVLISLGFASFGVSLLRDARLLSAREADEIEDALAAMPLDRRLLLAWQQTPARVQRAAATMRRFMTKVSARQIARSRRMNESK